MPACEKCWADAFDPYSDQSENYRRLLEERKGHPCTPKEQAGQWWDEERQCDIRNEPKG
jgi:hypothetical protein